MREGGREGAAGAETVVGKEETTGEVEEGAVRGKRRWRWRWRKLRSLRGAGSK